MVNKRRATQIKLGVFFLILLINFGVGCIWIPTALQISPKIAHINDIWDRIQKVVYLIVDAALNYYFVMTVKKRLVTHGLKKYEKLAKFNTRIVLLSVAMDVLIIGMMSYPNPYV